MAPHWRGEPSSPDGSEYLPDAIEFSILGPIEVAESGVRLDVGGPKERAALAVLCLWPGDVISTDRLADALWGDEPPRTSSKLIQNLVLHLRKTLGRDLIETRAAGYALQVAPQSVDARRFEQLVAAGRHEAAAGASVAAVASFASALELWRGAALPELVDWPPAQAETTRLDELRRCVEEEQADAALAAGRHREWVGRVETLVASEPLRERRWVLLMLAQYRCGRQVDALRAYQRARAALSELGLEPGPELRSVEHAIAAHDPALLSSADGQATPLPTGVVSFLLTDIEGSSELWDRAPKAMADALARHDEIIEKSVVAAGGVQLKSRGEGDSTFSVFTKTSAAVTAALSAFEALRSTTWPGGLSVAVRMAVHTGEAHERDGDYFGPTVNRAARLRALADGGQLLLSEAVAALVRDDLPEGWDLVELGEQTLRGHSRPERMFTLAKAGAVVDHRSTVVARSCPYMGLLPFQPQDERVFFGRTDLLQTLSDRLVATGFVAVVGASGTGKSSLLRAGLVARLRHGATSGSDEWSTVVLSPGTRPLAELAAQLGPLCGDSASDLLHDLEAEPRALDVAIRQALANRASDSKVVLVIDQLEELFTLCRNDADRTRFLDAIVDVVADEGGRAVVVVALRADFFAHAATHAPFARLLEAHTLLIGPMDEPSLREVIEGPARVAGLSLEPGLADVILRDVAGEPGDLPLLSHALLEVWTRRSGRTLTIAGYHATGGVSGAVAHTADSVYDALDPDRQRIARAIFVRLTELGEGTEDTRRRATLDELVGDPEQRRDVEQVLDVLASARLITIFENSIEVSHEALIRSWPRLRNWLDEDREGLRIMRHVTYSARDWADRGRDDSELYRGPRLAAALEWRTQHESELNPLENEFLDAGERVLEQEAQARARATRRLRTLLVGTGVALVVALIAGALAVNQRNRANRQADLARGATVSAEVDRIVADFPRLLKENRELAGLLAVEASRLRPDPATRGLLFGELFDEPRLDFTLHGGAVGYSGAAVVPNHREVVAVGRDAIDLWDLSSRRVAVHLDLPGVSSAAASPSGDEIALGNADGSLTFWDPTLQHQLSPAAHFGAAIANMTFAPDGNTLAVTFGVLGDSQAITPDNAPRLVDARSGRVVAELAGHGVTVSAFAFIPPDGRTVVAVENDGAVVLHDSTTGAPSRQLATIDTKGVGSVAVSPDGRLLAVGTISRGGPESAAVVLDIASGARLPTPPGPTGLVEVQFSPDGARLFVGDGSGALYQWRSSDLTEAAPPIATQHGPVLALGVVDGVGLVSAGFDGTVIVWQTDAIPSSRPVPGALDSGGWFSPDGSLLVTVGGEDTATVLRTSDFSVIANLSAHGAGTRNYNAGPTQVAFSADGRLLAINSRDGYVQLFDGHTFDRIGAPIQVTTTFLNGLEFSPDGRWLAVTSVNDTQGAWVIDVATRDLHALVPPPSRAVTPSFSPDGSRLVVVGIGAGAIEYPIRGGDVADGRQLDDLGLDLVQAVFSPDGHTLALGTFEGAVRLVDSQTLAPAAPPIKVSSDLIAFVVFSPDGHLLITEDQVARQLRIIDVEAHAPVGAPIDGNGQTYAWPGFSPDGHTVVLPHAGGDILFDFDPAQWLHAACSRAGRALTRDEWATYLSAAGSYAPTCRGT